MTPRHKENHDGLYMLRPTYAMAKCYRWDGSQSALTRIADSFESFDGGRRIGDISIHQHTVNHGSRLDIDNTVSYIIIHDHKKEQEIKVPLGWILVVTELTWEVYPNWDMVRCHYYQPSEDKMTPDESLRNAEEFKRNPMNHPSTQTTDIQYSDTATYVEEYVSVRTVGGSTTAQ